ncbi:MAG: hypothetical protein M3Y39_00150 [Chloroflexota bacterium]|nr:hypothetical protein [Chloroflexota bacterium]
MQQKTLSWYVGGACLLLTLAYALGVSHVTDTYSRTLTPVAQSAAASMPQPSSPDATLRGNSDTATPDTFGDLLLRGTLVLLTLVLCISLLLAQRRREHKRAAMPETDPALLRVPPIGNRVPSAELLTEEIPLANLPSQDAISRVLRLKNRLRAM